MIKLMLPVMEHFYTIQGEGHYSGHAAYFVRLGGCDVGCTWCDVKESWNSEIHPKLTLSELGNAVVSSGTNIAVVTGGEPLMHNLDALTEVFKSMGIRTHIETSGAHPLSGNWDWICLSPKRFKLPTKEVCFAAHELKVVISHVNDLRFAEKWRKEVKKDCKLFLQPEWDKRNEITPVLINYIKENPEWLLSIQLHKYIDVP